MLIQVDETEKNFNASNICLDFKKIIQWKVANRKYITMMRRFFNVVTFVTEIVPFETVQKK